MQSSDRIALASIVVFDAQNRARDKIERYDVGALHRAEDPERDPRMCVSREPVERNVEEGIVERRLMRDGHVEGHASVQERVRDVPMVVAEVPRAVLAARNDEDRPEGDDAREIEPLCRADIFCRADTGGALGRAGWSGWRRHGSGGTQPWISAHSARA